MGGNVAQLQTRKRENEESERHRLWQIGEATQCFQGVPTECFGKLGCADVAQMPLCSGENGVHRGADSGSLKERSKKRNVARVAKAHGSLKLQVEGRVILCTCVCI